MDLTGLLSALLLDPGVAQAVESVRTRGAVDVVGPHGIRPPLLAAFAGARTSTPPRAAHRDAAPPRDVGRPLVVVTTTGRDADELAEALRCYLSPDAVAVLPAWETLPHERLSPRSDTVA
ncbi:MAG: hypothetical protein ACYCTH_11865, partial [Cellulomonas sp.]